MINSIFASCSIGIGEIGDRAVERHRHRALGQRRRDALGDLEAGDVLREFALGAVGEGEGDLAGSTGFKLLRLYLNPMRGCRA